MAEPASPRSAGSGIQLVAGGIDDLDRLGSGLGRLYFVVGAFDGLHRGHAYLLARLREAAAAHRARPAVITFDHHPDEILVGAAPPVLCDPLERLVRFEHAGVDVVLIQHFDAALRLTPYDTFVGGIASRVDLAGFLMTPDAAFGHERGGTPAALAELGRTLAFEVSVVEPLEIDGRPVRSTEIRADIAEGRLDAARRLLGRSFAMVGRVERQGSRQSAERGPWSVSFELPVALPPAGRYRAGVEAAWAPDQPRTASPSPAIVDVGPGGEVSVELLGRRDSPAADRLRIRLIAPLG
jgi:riboflavin kinase / FMN adenylyltransferase